METTRYIGIDLSKRSMEIASVTNDSPKITRCKYTTNMAGQQAFLSILKPNDVVALETGNASFVLASLIKLNTQCKVYVLNAGKLHIIFESLKKTDKSDAVNIAKFIQRHPKEELPVVHIPDEKERALKRSVSESMRLQKERTRFINRLHNLYWDNGITDLKKKDLGNSKNRKTFIQQLSAIFQGEAQRLMQQIDLTEEQIKSIEKEQHEMLKDHLDHVTISMSMPGIGPVTALAILAFLGDMKRFNSGSQVTHFSGYTPKVDRSGDQNHLGSITKRGPKELRRVLNQAAWAAVRSKDHNSFQDLFQRIKAKKGNAKAIVAVARKMLAILYTLHSKQKLFYREDGKEHEMTLKKLSKYKLITNKKTKKKLD